MEISDIEEIFLPSRGNIIAIYADAPQYVVIALLDIIATVSMSAASNMEKHKNQDELK